MTDIQTRRLVVTLPDVSGEEADTIASDLEVAVLDATNNVDATVTHALGETLPDTARIKRFPDGSIVIMDPVDGMYVVLGTPYAIRQLAGALLALPDVADAEPPSPFQVVGETTAQAILGEEA